MTVNMIKIPFPVRLQILKLVDGQTLCRLRCASKFLDKFVEENRSRIYAPLPYHNLLCQIIPVRNSAVPRLKFSVRKEKRILTHRNICSTVNRSRTRIFRPVEELSAIKFHAIIVDLQEDSQEVMNVYRNAFLPLLEKLRIQCVHLCFENTDETLISPLFNMIFYRSLHFVDCEIQLASLKNWHIKGSLFFQVQVIFRTSEKCIVVDGTRLFVEQKKTAITCQLALLTVAWTIYLFFLHIVSYTFYKMIIAGGVAIIVQEKARSVIHLLELHFVDNYNRAALLPIVYPHIFNGGTPNPNASYFPHFLQLDDDSKAIQFLIDW